MNIDKIIKNLKIMANECDKVQNCSKCKVSNLCDKYCYGMTPNGAIECLKLLKNLENEELEGDK